MGTLAQILFTNLAKVYETHEYKREGCDEHMRAL